MSTTRAAVLRGLGVHLPDRVVTNAELAERLDTSDEWIRSRTGIGERRRAAPGELASDLAVQAGARALKSSGDASADAVVLATTTPDRPCPATAPVVADRLGLTGAAAFDVAAVCAGFVYALATASGLITSGVARRVLVIAAETYSRILDHDDRNTAVIFGDGAGAVVLEAGRAGEPGALLGFDLGSDGSGQDLITVPQPGSTFAMQGRPVFTHAVNRMSRSSQALLNRLDWPADTVDRLVGHQANVRILHSVADVLDIGRNRAVVNLDRVGNTSAASIPLALADAVRDGDLLPGHRVLLTAFGGGLAWGSAALVWPDITVDIEGDHR